MEQVNSQDDPSEKLGVMEGEYTLSSTGGLKVASALIMDQVSWASLEPLAESLDSIESTGYDIEGDKENRRQGDRTGTRSLDPEPS